MNVTQRTLEHYVGSGAQYLDLAHIYPSMECVCGRFMSPREQRLLAAPDLVELQFPEEHFLVDRTRPVAERVGKTDVVAEF